MDDFLLRLMLKIEVISPLHIGAGEKLSAKSFVTHNGEFVVIDERKLLTWVGANPQRVNDFMGFAEKPNDSLSEFFRRHRLVAQNFAAYRIANRASGRLRDVLSFIKSADGMPYLPGSSLKGSVRSALLRGVVVDQPALAKRLREMAEPLAAQGNRHVSDELEAQVLVPARNVKRGKRPNYDLIRAIGFSDSTRLSLDHLQVAEVRVLSSQSNQTLKFKLTPHGNNIMQIYVETVRAGAVLRLPITLDRALLEGRGAAGQLRFASRSTLIADFSRFCRISAANLIEQEINFYQSHRHSDLVRWYSDRKAELEKMPKSSFLLPVGWGTGFDAKTVTDQLGEEVFRSVVNNYKNTRRMGKPSGTNQWLGQDLSPKSRKVILHPDDRLEPMGWVRIHIQET